MSDLVFVTGFQEPGSETLERKTDFPIVIFKISS